MSCGETVLPLPVVEEVPETSLPQSNLALFTSKPKINTKRNTMQESGVLHRYFIKRQSFLCCQWSHEFNMTTLTDSHALPI